MSKHFGPASLTLAAAIVVASCGQSDEAQATEDAAPQTAASETAPVQEPSNSVAAAAQDAANAAEESASAVAAAAQETVDVAEETAPVVVAAAQEAADDAQAADEEPAAEEAATDEAAADEAAGADVVAAVPAGDAAAGKRVFARCMACHALAEGQNRVGPSLHGLFGRTAGTVEGFRYSQANQDSGVTWSEATLFEYLKNPREYIPGTIMAFPGLPSEDDRANLIAYLKENT